MQHGYKYIYDKSGTSSEFDSHKWAKLKLNLKW